MATTTIKTLTDTTYDSVEGYRKSIEKAKSPQLKQALQQRLQSREQTLNKLNAEMQRQVGELVTKGTMSGELHQMWLGITNMFDSGDEAVAERVEEGEDYLKGKFESALEDNDMDTQQRSVIQQAYAEICEGERFGDMIENQHD